MTPPLATATTEPLRAIMRSFEFTATSLPLPVPNHPAASVRHVAPSADPKSSSAQRLGQIQNRK